MLGPWPRQQEKKKISAPASTATSVPALTSDAVCCLLLGFFRRRELAVLLIEPGLQRREIFDQRAAVDFVFARDFLQRLRPWFARAHGQHRLQLGAGFGVAVDRAAMQRTGITSLAAQRAVELELQ